VFCTLIYDFHHTFSYSHKYLFYCRVIKDFSRRKGADNMSIMQLTQTIHILPSVQSLQSNRAVQPMLPGLEPEEETRPMVTNRQVAEVLSSIANLLEFQNSNPYRI